MARRARSGQRGECAVRLGTAYVLGGRFRTVSENSFRFHMIGKRLRKRLIIQRVTAATRVVNNVVVINNVVSSVTLGSERVRVFFFSERLTYKSTFYARRRIFVSRIIKLCCLRRGKKTRKLNDEFSQNFTSLISDRTVLSSSDISSRGRGA